MTGTAPESQKHWLWQAVVVLAMLTAYANSFDNGFHFDDFHTVTDNPAIRSLRNVPRFFTDATTFSVLPANRTYRPLVSTSLAVDYWLGRGYSPVWFHLGTFLLFVWLVRLLHGLYRLFLDKTETAAANKWVALLGSAWFGLHPAMAETVNYVIQRGDLYCTLGCVGALYVFASRPEWRRRGLYLLPLVLALLSKPPAAVFPVLLLLYVYFFESASERQGPRWKTAALAAVPSVVVTGLMLWLQSAMTPKSFQPSTLKPWEYCWTQPFVWSRYAAALFLPLHLNVDTDLQPFRSWNADAVVGLLFVLALMMAIGFTARRRRLYPIAYGLLWFVVTQLPTSLYPLSEVENDHRMFFSFVGLILAVVWAVWLVVEGIARERARLSLAVAAAAVLCGYAYGVHVRNAVWHDEESLWRDDVRKSPHNGRGLMIYGLTQMNKGANSVALDYFTRALEFTPNYPTLEINLGVVNGLTGYAAEAERHFRRAVTLAAEDDSPHAYYGRWLETQGRLQEAIGQLNLATSLDPQRQFQHDLLIDAYDRAGDLSGARTAAEETLTVIPDDTTALQQLAHPPVEDVPYWINLSLAQNRGGQFVASIASAQQALLLDTNCVEAYTNIGAGYAGLGQWDLAVRNEQEALKRRPDYELAKNNLVLYEQQQVRVWLDRSLQLSQQGRYEESIAVARQALGLDARSAIAWNNIAAGYEGLHQWDDAMDAARKAISLEPDFQLAKNNLAWAESQKTLGVR